MAEYLYRMIIARLALAMLLLLLLLPSSASGMYDQPGRYYDWGDFSSLEEARMWYEDARSPVAYDCSVTIRENAFAEILLGAADPDGDALSYVICTGPSNGTLVTQNGNAVVYAPCKNFTGVDSFTFRANDRDRDSNSAFVTITITPDASTPVSHAFHGNVTIDGLPAPGPGQVLATGPGVRSDTKENPVVTMPDGSYGSEGELVVQGVIENDTPISFYIDGVPAEVREASNESPWQKAWPFRAGEKTRLDIRGISPPPTPDEVYIDTITMTISNSSFVFTKDMKLRGNPWIEASVTGGMFIIEMSASGVHRFSFDPRFRRDATFGIYENGVPLVPEKTILFGSKELDYRYFATGTRTFEIRISVDEEPEINDVRHITIFTTPP